MPHTARYYFGLLCIFPLVSLIFTPLAHASGYLLDGQDVISHDQTSLPNVSHMVSFTLPLDSEIISSSDYIHIDLPHFTDVTLVNGQVTGSYLGNPEFSQEGNTIKVTGIAVLRGNRITISGITATNPDSQNLYQVQVSVTEDAEGLIIKNITSFLATGWGGSVTVSASIAPATASLLISGYSAPGTFITFTENGTVIGTETAGLLGTFTKLLLGLDPGTHNITMYGVDLDNRTTSILPIEVQTPIYQQTTVSDLLLSPTIEIDATEVTQGDPLIVSGSTIISGDLSIFTESPLRTYYATADTSGNWDYTIDNTSEYIPGDYRIYSLVQNGTGSQSLFSNSLQFSVLPSSGPTPSPPGCGISQGDLNCDSHTNLTDFSILMYYWGTTSASADINSDGTVNLIDFSIMMYYWGT
ncbi:MAG: dockerin type I domain-containing protein [Patescibacteria group bacterium]|jgi:hypothetical protein